ncbi:MAG: hypothetical protein KBT39_03955 [Bacteroidales bacterium]|nr:hypothetical protein [Bacteroidales bacterium]
MELPEDLKLLIQDSVEVVEITLYRMKGINHTPLKTLDKITDIIAKSFLENENAILYFYCDDLAELPSVKKNIRPQEYRSRLFSSLFERYIRKNNLSDIINYPITIFDVEGVPMRIHLFARECHSKYVEIISNDLIDNYSKPSE